MKTYGPATVQSGNVHDLLQQFTALALHSMMEFICMPITIENTGYVNRNYPGTNYILVSVSRSSINSMETTAVCNLIESLNIQLD